MYISSEATARVLLKVLNVLSYCAVSLLFIRPGEVMAVDGASRTCCGFSTKYPTCVDSLPVNENGWRKLDIRFAGDGRHTSRRVGSVMCVISLLAETETNASREYTVNLYNGRLEFKA